MPFKSKIYKFDNFDEQAVQSKTILYHKVAFSSSCYQTWPLRVNASKRISVCVSIIRLNTCDCLSIFSIYISRLELIIVTWNVILIRLTYSLYIPSLFVKLLSLSLSLCLVLFLIIFSPMETTPWLSVEVCSRKVQQLHRARRQQQQQQQHQYHQPRQQLHNHHQHQLK